MADKKREQGSEPGAGRQTTGTDWLIPILAAAFAAYYLWSIADMRWEAKVSGFLVATVLAVLIGVFAIRTAVGIAKGRLVIDFLDWGHTREGLARQAIMIALIIAFIVVIPYLGFTLAVFVFLTISLATIARLRLTRVLAIAAVMSLSGYLLFIAALRTNFPTGPFERLVAAILG